MQSEVCALLWVSFDFPSSIKSNTAMRCVSKDYPACPHKKKICSWLGMWYTSIIPAIWEVEVEDQGPSMALGKSMIPYMKNN
jgi:hypothetical protein